MSKKDLTPITTSAARVGQIVQIRSHKTWVIGRIKDLKRDKQGELQVVVSTQHYGRATVYIQNCYYVANKRKAQTMPKPNLSSLTRDAAKYLVSKKWVEYDPHARPGAYWTLGVSRKARTWWTERFPSPKTVKTPSMEDAIRRYLKRRKMPTVYTIDPLGSPVLRRTPIGPGSGILTGWNEEDEKALRREQARERADAFPRARKGQFWPRAEHDLYDDDSEP